MDPVISQAVPQVKGPQPDHSEYIRIQGIFFPKNYSWENYHKTSFSKPTDKWGNQRKRTGMKHGIF